MQVSRLKNASNYQIVMHALRQRRFIASQTTSQSQKPPQHLLQVVTRRSFHFSGCDLQKWSSKRVSSTVRAWSIPVASLPKARTEDGRLQDHDLRNHNRDTMLYAKTTGPINIISTSSPSTSSTPMDTPQEDLFRPRRNRRCNSQSSRNTPPTQRVQRNAAEST